MVLNLGGFSCVSYFVGAAKAVVFTYRVEAICSWVILMKTNTFMMSANEYLTDNVKGGDMHAEANKVIRPPARLML